MPLTLSRKPGESLMIGDDIKITILGADRFGGTRIQFEAPKNVEIWREEIYQDIKAKQIANKRSA